MKSRFFIRISLRKKIEKDLAKRTKLEEKMKKYQAQLDLVNIDIKKDIRDFENEADDETIQNTFKYIGVHGTKKQKEYLKEITERYKTSKLDIEDTLNLIDWYEEMLDE